jgi:hypothetical protein
MAGGAVRLVQEPRDSNGNVAVVNIQDPKGGSEGYTYELTWEASGFGGPDNSSGGGGGFFPGGGNSGGGNSGGGFFPGTGGSLSDMNVSSRGFGSLNYNGETSRLNEIQVRVQGNQCDVTIYSGQGQNVQMSGVVSRGQPECAFTRSNNGRIRGRARFTMNGDRLHQVTMTGDLNNSPFDGSFTLR